MARPAKLTAQMEAFCRHYVASGGNLTAAAKAAGYKGTNKQLNQQGKRLKEKDQVAQRIVELTSNPDVLTVEALQRWWSGLVLGFPVPTPTEAGIVDLPPPMPVRLKSSEYLAKTQGGFVDKIEVRTGTVEVELPDNARGDRTK